MPAACADTLDTARKYLHSLGRTPSMWASTKEAYLAQVTAILAMALPNFEESLGFFGEHAEKEGNAYINLEKPVDQEWADKVIKAALFRLPEGDVYRNNMEMAILSFLDTGAFLPLGDLYHLMKEVKGNNEYWIAPNYKNPEKKGMPPQYGSLQKLLGLARAWGAFVPSQAKYCPVEEIKRTVYRAEIWKGTSTLANEEKVTRDFNSEESALLFAKEGYEEAIKVLKTRSDIQQDSIRAEWFPESEHQRGKIVCHLKEEGKFYGLKLYFGYSELELDYTIYP